MRFSELESEEWIEAIVKTNNGFLANEFSVSVAMRPNVDSRRSGF